MGKNDLLLQPRETIPLLALLLLGVTVRLIQISQPFVDGWSWRQSDVAMIAENFYRHGFNIFYPQINWAGNSPGYVGSEFPLVPFIASLLYVFFGVHDWVGRSVSVFFFAVSVPFFYLLVRKVSNQRAALFSVGIYILTPLSIFCSRSFMSDMASLSLSIVAVYLFAEWQDRPTDSKLLITAIVATSLAILVKPPAILIGLPLFYMAWKKYGARLFLRGMLWAFAGFSLIFPLLWYSHGYLISKTYPPYGLWGSRAIKIMGLNYYKWILRQTVTSSLTPIVFAGMLVGIVLPSRAKLGRLFHWWFIPIILFIVIAGHGNRHEWYRLPLVPVAAAFAGLACEFIFYRFARLAGSRIAVTFAGLFFVVLAYLSYIYVNPRYEPWAIPLWKAGNELHRIAPPDALAIVADDGDPTAIYYSRRKGWHFLQNNGNWWGNPVDSQEAINELEKLRKEGAKFLVFTQYTRWWLDYYTDFQQHLDSQYRRVRDTEEYVIFNLIVAKARHLGWSLPSPQAVA